MGTRLLEMSLDMVVAVLKPTPKEEEGFGRSFTVEENALPEDAAIVAYEVSNFRTISFVLSSESWEGQWYEHDRLPSPIIRMHLHRLPD